MKLPELPALRGQTLHLMLSTVAIAEGIMLRCYGAPSFHEDIIATNILQPVGLPAQKQLGTSSLRIPNMPNDILCRTLTPVVASRADRASNEVSTSFTQLGRHAYVNLEHELLHERDPLKRRAVRNRQVGLASLAISRQT